MPIDPHETLRDKIDAIYRAESRRVLATLIRLLGDLDLAEDALQDAFTAAVAQWPRGGLPANPRAWLVSTGRRRGAADPRHEEIARHLYHMTHAM
jgi:RNA polymerase sigma-70 factor (ECF subfamily)